MSKPKHSRLKPHEAEIDRLKKDLVCARAWIETWKLAAEEVQRRRDEKDAEVKRLREALEFYADEGNYTSDENGNLICSAWQGNRVGMKARAALGKGEEKQDD